MLDQAIQQQLKQYLANVKEDVRLVVSLDESKASNDILSLANQIAEMSDFITVERDDNASARKPVMTVTNPVKAQHFALLVYQWVTNLPLWYWHCCTLVVTQLN